MQRAITCGVWPAIYGDMHALFLSTRALIFPHKGAGINIYMLLYDCTALVVMSYNVT